MEFPPIPDCVAPGATNSGPKRYDYVLATDDWRYSRDGEEMGALVECELTELLGRMVKLDLRRVSHLG